MLKRESMDILFQPEIIRQSWSVLNILLNGKIIDNILKHIFSLFIKIASFGLVLQVHFFHPPNCSQLKTLRQILQEYKSVLSFISPLMDLLTQLYIKLIPEFYKIVYS